MKKQLQPIENVDGFRKDPENGAILNVDSGALDAYKKRRQSSMYVQQELNNIKGDIAELKDLMKQLVSSVQEKRK